VVQKSLKKLEDLVDSKEVQQNMRPWDSDESVSLYSQVYNLCIMPDSVFYEEQFYCLYSLYLRKYLQKTVLPVMKEKQGEDLLMEVAQSWKKYRDVFAKFCTHVFRYLDKFYVLAQNKRTLREEAACSFRLTVFESLKTQLRRLVLHKIEVDRNSQSGADDYFRQVLKDILTLFTEMGEFKACPSDPMNVHTTMEVNPYVDEFESHAEKETQEYYHKLSEEWLEKYNLSEYLLRADECLHQEHQRITSIFPSQSVTSLLKICEHELLIARQSRLLEMPGSGVRAMMRDDKIDDLKRLYKLNSRVPHGLEPICGIFKVYVTEVGKEIVGKSLAATQEIMKGDENISSDVYNRCVKKLLDIYVVDLVEFHKKMTNILQGPFKKDLEFMKSLSEGFRIFVNQNIALGAFDVRVAQLFAYFTDELLRKKSEDNNLDCIIQFVQYFNDKDMFIEEYRKQFAKRLLLTEFQEVEERMMISKLKYLYRAVSDIYKLEKMLSDKSMANELKNDFQTYLANNQIQLSVDLSVTVLTTGMWPLKTKETLSLPKDIADSQMIFKQYYDSRYSKRVLKWVYSKSTVQLMALYASGNHLFEMTTLQAAVVLLFNDSPSLTVQQIEEAIGLSYEPEATIQDITTESKPPSSSSTEPTSSELDLKQAIHSLTTDRLKILTLTNNTVVLNENFSHKLYKIKVPLPRVTQKETRSTQLSISADRVYILDACVVRIMKTRKTLNFHTLISEVVNQVSNAFSPDVKQIKKRIESLISRDYLARDATNNSIINYVA